MNAVTAFQFENDAHVRVILRDGDPWFVAADVCRVLEIGNVSQTLSRLDEDEKGIIPNDTLGGVQNMATVNESGLYSLILGSRKPAAKRFKKWVTAEVLPSIRKTGAYGQRRENAAPPSTMAVETREYVDLLKFKVSTLEAAATPKPKRPAPIPLTEEERAMIYQLADEGLSQTRIAEATGRSRAMISIMLKVRVKTA